MDKNSITRNNLKTLKNKILDKKQKIIGGIIVLVLVVFGTNNYLSFEKENKKRKIEYNSNNNEKSNDIIKENNNQKVTEKLENDEFISENKVFTYSSDFYDLEKPDGSINTKNEITYHTFDFNKKVVTQNSILNGNRLIMEFPFYEMYQEKGIAATTYVLKVNTLGLKEIWWSPNVPNLGYDYEDGTRIACYDLKVEIKK